MLYVTSLTLTNIRCFSYVEFDLSPRRSILIVGDNGDGKSTVLRSLAMGLTDQSSASALFRELPGEFVRHGVDDDGVIDVRLSNGSGSEYHIRTIIRSLETFERVEQELFESHKGARRRSVTQDEFPWEKIFASGYGAGIRTTGTADFEYYLTVDAVYPLFKYDVALQNPELVIRRLIAKSRHRSKNPKKSESLMLAALSDVLAEMLQLEKGARLVLTDTGIALVDRSGQIELSSLGDGYRATVTWVLDLLAWWFLKRRQDRSRVPILKPEGIVIVDEIEQHLHPRWQRNIISLLHDAFEGIQLIATSHSPLVASGCQGVPVHRLRHGEHVIEAPFGWLAEDVYRFMGLSTSRSQDFMDEQLERFKELDRRRLEGQLTAKEEREFRKAKAMLDSFPETDPISLLVKIRNLGRKLSDDEE